MEGRIIKIELVLHALPPNERRIDPFNKVLSAEKYSDTCWAEEPLVRVSGQEIDTIFLHVHWNYAEALDRVNAEKDSAVPAESTQSFYIQPVPIRVLNRAYR